MASRWHRRNVVLAGALCLLAALATAVVVPGPIGYGPACPTQVRTPAQLQSAVAGSLGEGGVICVRAGDYGRVRLAGRHPAKVTVRAAPGERPVLGGVTLDGVSNLRIEGLSFTAGGIDTNRTGAQGIEIVRNRFEGYAGAALILWGGDADVTFEGNVVRDLRANGEWQAGWGVLATGLGDRVLRNLRIRYNTFDHTENDAMQLAATHGGEVVGNEVLATRPPPGIDDHADSLMLWGASRDFLIKDNRFMDGNGLLMSGSTSDVRLENNLIVRMDNYCHDGGTTGTSSQGLVRYTWIRNTMYDCGSAWAGGGFGGGYGLLSDGPATAGASNRVERNVLASLQPQTNAQFAYEDHNVIVHGVRRGAHDLALRPVFADRVDYQPTNLPAGHRDVGYRPAPAGAAAAPPAAPCAGLSRRAASRCRGRGAGIGTGLVRPG